ncbi:MAG: hypothetical protein H0V66_03245, partial [Bdellovibrionales bacterium]|nr:hypothetical protein [Bdellovibrionales bacterium]
MKIILIAMLSSLTLWAQSPELCEQELYSPHQALKDINTGKLTFMGRQIFPGSGQNYTCVYKSQTAYIL